MKLKLVIGVAILPFLFGSALAQEIYPREGATDDPPYLLNVHGCNLQGISAGSRFVPIKRNSSYVVLIVSPSRYWKIKSSVNNEILQAKESSADLKKAKKKISEFEDAGNIPAMEHWERKMATIDLEITKSVNRRFLPKIAQEIVTSEHPSTYYGRSEKDRYRANTLQELIDVTGDNCSEALN